MAVDKKISQLTSLAQVDVSASTDVLPIVDTSATETKKITVSALVGAGATAGISGAVLTNGTINSTTIGATTPSTGAFTTLSASGNFTLSGGTANGVLYLNGSKVATSGSALVFDGTNLGIGTTSPDAKLSVNGVASFGAGAAALPSVAGFGDLDTGMWFPAANTLAWSTGGSERMRLDTSGNLGLGVVPGAWDTGNSVKALQISSAGALWNFSTNNIYLSQNVIWNGTNRVYNVTGSLASEFSILNGVFTFSNAASGTAGNTITLSERMRIDSSGNVGIGGTAGADTKVQVMGTLTSSFAYSIGFYNTATIPSGTTNTAWMFRSLPSTQAASFTLSNLKHFEASQILTIGAGSSVTNQYGFFVDSGLTGATNNYGFYSNIASGSNRWNFYAAGTAANYFAGNTGVGRSPSYRLDVEQTADTPTARIFSNQAGFLSSNQAVLFIDVNNGTANSTASFSIIADYNGTEQFKVRNDGTIYAQNTTVQSISDNRVKENVRTATEGLSVIDALRPVRFDFKEGFGNNRKNQLGFVAQEVEAVFPDAVDVMGDKDENGDLYKSVGPAALIPVLVKAIQELSAKVAALEAK